MGKPNKYEYALREEQRISNNTPVDRTGRDEPGGWTGASPFPPTRKKVTICNAFSLQMIARHPNPTWEGERCHSFCIEQVDAPDLHNADVSSYVGHADIARLISAQTLAEIPVNRESFRFAPGSEIYVAQYTGPRLPEGTTELPEGAEIQWWRVREEELCPGFWEE